MPLAGAVRNANEVVKIGSQSFIAIGAGTRIINVTPSNGQPGFPDVRNGVLIGPTQKPPG